MATGTMDTEDLLVRLLREGRTADQQADQNEKPIPQVPS